LRILVLRHCCKSCGSFVKQGYRYGRLHRYAACHVLCARHAVWCVSAIAKACSLIPGCLSSLRISGQQKRRKAITAEVTFEAALKPLGDKAPRVCSGWIKRTFLQFCVKRARNSFVLSFLGFLNISSGVPSSQITPSDMKMTWLLTSRANAIS